MLFSALVSPDLRAQHGFICGKTYLDFRDDVESIAIPRIRKIDIHKRIYNSIRIVSHLTKRVSEVGSRVLDSGATAQDNESSDDDEN